MDKKETRQKINDRKDPANINNSPILPFYAYEVS